MDKRRAIYKKRIIEVIPEFIYLGSKVNNDNGMVAEMRARLLSGVI